MDEESSDIASMVVGDVAADSGAALQWAGRCASHCSMRATPGGTWGPKQPTHPSAHTRPHSALNRLVCPAELLDLDDELGELAAADEPELSAVRLLLGAAMRSGSSGGGGGGGVNGCLALSHTGQDQQGQRLRAHRLHCQNGDCTPSSPAPPSPTPPPPPPPALDVQAELGDIDALLAATMPELPSMDIPYSPEAEEGVALDDAAVAQYIKALQAVKGGDASALLAVSTPGWDPGGGGTGRRCGGASRLMHRAPCLSRPPARAWRTWGRGAAADR